MATPITIMIPTRNETAEIADGVRQLASAGEVIVVDGASTDGTAVLCGLAAVSVFLKCARHWERSR